MNLSPVWSDFLERAGHAATHWSAIGDPRAPDEEILLWARAHDHIVLTHDLDFGAILAAGRFRADSRSSRRVAFAHNHRGSDKPRRRSARHDRARGSPPPHSSTQMKLLYLLPPRQDEAAWFWSSTRRDLVVLFAFGWRAASERHRRSRRAPSRSRATETGRSARAPSPHPREA
jgi:hypothetical protein